MPLKGKKILLKPLNPKKLEQYTDGNATLQELLHLDGVEDELANADLTPFRKRCEANPERSYWHVPWIVIRKGDHRGLAVLSVADVPNEHHEVTLAFAEGEDFFREKCEAFELLCEWVAGHDKVYFLRTELSEENVAALEFIQTLGFQRLQESNVYEREGAASVWLATLICAGIGIGASLGFLIGSMPLGSAMGLMAGAAFGSYLDKRNKEERKRK